MNKIKHNKISFFCKEHRHCFMKQLNNIEKPFSSFFKQCRVSRAYIEKITKKSPIVIALVPAFLSKISIVCSGIMAIIKGVVSCITFLPVLLLSSPIEALIHVIYNTPACLSPDILRKYMEDTPSVFVIAFLRGPFGLLIGCYSIVGKAILGSFIELVAWVVYRLYKRLLPAG